MDTHFERTSQMMISPGSVGVRTEWRWSGQCPSHLFNRTRSAPSAVLLIIKLSHLWDGSGQPAVLLQVCTERVRAVDGGGSLIALHLNTQVTTFTSSLDYSHLVVLCSTAAHCVPGTPRRWWCSECRCYSGRRSPPLSPWTPRLTGAPDTHTHTHTHTYRVSVMTCCRCEAVLTSSLTCLTASLNLRPDMVLWTSRVTRSGRLSVISDVIRDVIYDVIMSTISTFHSATFIW